MTKRTLTRLNRDYEEIKLTDGSKQVVKRLIPIPAATPVKQPCSVCGGPMLVSPGTLQKYHKICRRMRSARGRRKVKRERGYKTLIKR